MRSVWWLCAGLLLGVLAGCEEQQLCLTRADCASGMRCTAEGLCAATDAGPKDRSDAGGAVPVVASEDRGTAPADRGVDGGNNALGEMDGSVPVPTQSNALEARLSGKFGEGEVSDSATVLYSPEGGPGDATWVVSTGRAAATGMLRVELPMPLRDVPPDTRVDVASVMVCGRTVWGPWSYDTTAGQGTVTVSPNPDGGSSLLVVVLHGQDLDQKAVARIQLPPF